MTMKLSSTIALPLATIFTIIVSVAGASWGLAQWISGKDIAAREVMLTHVAALQSSIDELGDRIGLLEVAVEAKTADRFTMTAAAEVAARNAMRNPGVSFADPRNPSEFFYVEPPK